MRMGLALCLGAALMLSAPAVLSQTKPLKINAVLAEQAQLRAELEAASGRATKISPDRRADVLAKQQELLDLLEGKQSASELTAPQQAFAHDTLAWIEAAVEDDNDGRVVCRREKKLGSNMVARVCRTVAEMKLDQERARETMMESSRD